MNLWFDCDIEFAAIYPVRLAGVDGSFLERRMVFDQQGWLVSTLHHTSTHNPDLIENIIRPNLMQDASVVPN